MKITRNQNVIAVALAGALIFTSTALFAQQPAPPQPTALESVQDQVMAVPQPVFDPIKQPSKAGRHILRQSFEGVDFIGSNCGCLPPDTNAAVGNNFVVETVNFQIRIFNKTMGNILLDEPLATFFGAFSGGDVYVVYDDTADRWYVSAFDTDDDDLFLAVSLDGNPLYGFLPTYILTDVGGFPDYEKPGFNRDAIFISFNNFGPGGGSAATIASIDKRPPCRGL